jgi:small conductance mechanosensitive channel
MEVQQLIEKGYELVTVFGVKILAALAVFIIGRWVVKYLGNLVQRVMEKRNVDTTLTKFVASLTYIALLTFVIVAARSWLLLGCWAFKPPHLSPCWVRPAWL